MLVSIVSIKSEGILRHNLAYNTLTLDLIKKPSMANNLQHSLEAMEACLRCIMTNGHQDSLEAI